jgi:cysteine synthase A
LPQERRGIAKPNETVIVESSSGNRARIFPPFGLGVLDIVVSDLIFQEAVRSGTALAIPDFFSNSVRW